ncbi:MAG TPA: hypothetical protein VEQ18_04605, partial [Candidatus Nitrosocosmicus sp.]|nr:hypothetical protein [Candidatus Nitrosocosmicus sp.]
MSGVTNVNTEPAAPEEALLEFEKIAKQQKEFWENHTHCFLHDMETKTVHIDQCVIANVQYVIRTLQKDMMENVANELVQMIDVNQRQKLCLTPINSKGKLLKEKPTDWEQIK